MFRRFIVWLSCAAALAAGTHSEGECKMPEIRAIWVARWDIASPEACRTIVKVAKDHNFNALIIQVRGRGDALYDSRYEPRSELLDGQSRDFDPLALILDEGHRAGLQVHAWVNANYTWGAADPPASPRHIVNAHPDWLMRTVDNKLEMVGGSDVEGAYTCPSNSVFRDFLRNIYMDVLRKYAVDGVHFDFIRYPSTRFCYCDRCLAKFKGEMDKKISVAERLAVSNSPDRISYTRAFPAAWDDFRREQITKMVYAVYDSVKAFKPNVLVSASVFPGFDDAYNHRFQDWKRWLRDGKLDILFPMAYSKSTDTFAEHIRDAVESSGPIPVCAGIGAWQIPAESALEKVQKARELGAAGFCLFSWAVAKDGKDTSYLAYLRDHAMTDAVALPLVGLEEAK